MKKPMRPHAISNSDQDSTQKECDPENNITVSRTYPIFYQYGEYSVRLSHLNKQEMSEVTKKLAELNITLIERGYNF